jgi:tetraacyldisaccharide 4'-kinase
LATKGLETINHPFPDHHFFNAKQIHFKDSLPIFMTEKDAVKCSAFASDKHWFVPIEAQLPDSFFQNLLNLLNKKS